MKRTAAILLTITLALALCACGETPPEPVEAQVPASETPETAEAPTPAPTPGAAEAPTPEPVLYPALLSEEELERLSPKERFLYRYDPLSAAGLIGTPFKDSGLEDILFNAFSAQGSTHYSVRLIRLREPGLYRSSSVSVDEESGNICCVLYTFGEATPDEARELIAEVTEKLGEPYSITENEWDAGLNCIIGKTPGYEKALLELDRIYDINDPMNGPDIHLIYELNDTACMKYIYTCYAQSFMILPAGSK